MAWCGACLSWPIAVYLSCCSILRCVCSYRLRIKRMMCRAPFARIPIDAPPPSLLLNLYARIGYKHSFHASQVCSFLLVFFAFPRKSNAVRSTQSACDSLWHAPLRRKHFFKHILWIMCHPCVEQNQVLWEKSGDPISGDCGVYFGLCGPFEHMWAH